MANETIGKLKHHCGESADVRKDKNRRLYVNCPCCGQLKYNLQGGQNYILDNTVMFDRDGKLPAEKSQRNVTNERDVRTNIPNVEKKGGFMDGLDNKATE